MSTRTIPTPNIQPLPQRLIKNHHQDQTNTEVYYQNNTKKLFDRGGTHKKQKTLQALFFLRKKRACQPGVQG